MVKKKKSEKISTGKILVTIFLLFIIIQVAFLSGEVLIIILLVIVFGGLIMHLWGGLDWIND